jgi:hypothetical protein
MMPFHAHSDNFYGDIGQVKVAVRKDCSSLESERLRQLAQQVRFFLISKIKLKNWFLLLGVPLGQPERHHGDHRLRGGR